MAEITNAMIDKEIGIFTTDRDKLRDHGQKIAMMIVNHAAPEDAGPNAQGTGDCTRFVMLAEAMPNSWTGQLSSWLIAFTPIRITGTKAAYDDEYKKLRITPEMTAEEKAAIRAERLTWWKLEDAVLAPFHTFKEPSAVAKTLDIPGIIKFLEAQAKSLEKKAGDDKVGADAVIAARAVADQLRAIKVPLPVAANDEGDAEQKRA